MTGGPPVGELVRTARSPDVPVDRQHAAFSLLVERFEAMALTVALSASDDLEAARDACQEAFLLAWRRLPGLRDPAAFGGWLKRLVRTQCARRRRREGRASAALDPEGLLAGRGPDLAEAMSRADAARRIRRCVARLPDAEREAVIRFYLLGESLRATAGAMGTPVGTAGKRLHSARLRLRRALPRSVAAAFLTRGPTPAFTRAVRDGVFREFEGEYRFASRPDRPVIIRREADVLVSYAAGQRNVLVAPGPDTLAATEFDGEGRFERWKNGKVRRFVYYEFGRRLGVARKVTGGESR